MRAAMRIGAALSTVGLWAAVCGFYEPASTSDPRYQNLHFRQDGKFVHNVGRLQLQVTNIGQTGNALNPLLTSVPSAEWPPGSGNDYLYAAGLWIGAIDASGIPHVTTAAFEREFAPDQRPDGACAPGRLDQIADIRESYEGIPGGNRVISPSLNPDDDGDGLIDEDFLNGIDDDGDGLCDEDYAATGQQMFSCEYFDDFPTIRQLWAEHVPLGVRVRQTSYAWATPGQNDFVGMDYQITNRSGRSLRNVVVAIFADMDLGNRSFGNTYFSDDHVGLFDSTVTYIGSTGEVVKRRVQMGYMYDNPDNPSKPQEAKGGDVPGYFGCMFLNHTTDPAGVSAPRRVGITSFKFFSGSGSFITGGDPENDAQRYQLITDPTLDPDLTGPVRSSRPLDYRFVMATGPFRSLPADSSLTVSVAWVMGLGYGGGELDPGGTLVANAIAAQQVFDGLYTDLDGDQTTGTCGKERCLQAPPGIRLIYEIADSSLCRLRFRPDPTVGGTFPQFSDVPSWEAGAGCDQQGRKFLCVDQALPLLTHCASQDTLDIAIGENCEYVDFDCDVNTGQGGREFLAHWVAATPLPAPFYAGEDGRGEPAEFLKQYSTTSDSAQVSAWFFPGDRKVTLKWSNFAELVRDAQRGNLKEFVGYRIYKASGWNRPLGTNAPSRELWSLLGEWRVDPKGTAARPLSELIDPSLPVVRVDSVTVSWDPIQRRPSNTEFHIEYDSLFAVGRYSYVDKSVLNGFAYFYSIVPISIIPGSSAETDIVLVGNPSATNAQVVYPRSDAQKDQDRVYVVPNPYKGTAQWDLVPRDEDPSGTKITFHNLPRTKGVIHIFTLAGDLVRDIPFDGRPPADLQYAVDPVTAGQGEASWNLISRNGQSIVSGIYLYSVDTELGKQVGRFVIVK